MFKDVFFIIVFKSTKSITQEAFPTFHDKFSFIGLDPGQSRHVSERESKIC